ncbi:UAP56-interacting factor-like isoform X2 [Stigmatopora argus]
MNKRHLKTTPLRDKMDMSLDDIIRLKRKEQHWKRKPAKTDPASRPQRTPSTTRGNMKSRSGNTKSVPGGVFRGGGAAKLRTRRGRGLGGAGAGPAAPKNLVRRAARKGGPQAFLGRRPLGRNAPEVPKTGRAVKSPFPRQRRRLPPARHTDARQATFLRRRGLKVQALVRKPNPPRALPVGTRPWRTWTNNTGLLTVSIDNPAAMTQPEPPRAWTLHPPTPQVTREEPAEKTRRPKGVPLRFQIKRVGKAISPKKQTSLSLNERFGILKARRAPRSQGGRLVLVD